MLLVDQDSARQGFSARFTSHSDHIQNKMEALMLSCSGEMALFYGLFHRSIDASTDLLLIGFDDPYSGNPCPRVG